jgi:vacuolar-type H+-ATPase catalytic subunit A/Vma1
MLRNIMAMNRYARDAVEQGVQAEAIMALPVQEEISRSRYIPEADMEELDAILGRIDTQVRELKEERAGVSESAQ